MEQVRIIDQYRKQSAAKLEPLRNYIRQQIHDVHEEFIFVVNRIKAGKQVDLPDWMQIGGKSKVVRFNADLDAMIVTFVYKIT